MWGKRIRVCVFVCFVNHFCLQSRAVDVQSRRSARAGWLYTFTRPRSCLPPHLRLSAEWCYRHFEPRPSENNCVIIYVNIEIDIYPSDLVTFKK